MGEQNGEKEQGWEWSRCEGMSANPGGCQALARWAIERPAGPNKVVRRYACGRHVGWLLRYMTVPGRAVTVWNLGEPPADSGSQGGSAMTTCQVCDHKEAQMSESSGEEGLRIEGDCEACDGWHPEGECPAPSGEYVQVPVKPLVVVYALRYALPRASGALSDVVPAIQAAWPHMDAGLRSAVQEDVRYAVEKAPASALYAPERDLMLGLLDFLDRAADSGSKGGSDAAT